MNKEELKVKVLDFKNAKGGKLNYARAQLSRNRSITHMKNTVIDIVNNFILGKIAKGINPWVKTWTTYNGFTFRGARNYVTNKPYQGINNALLESGYYLSAKQVKDLKGEIIDKSDFSIAVFWKRTTYEETSEYEDEETGEIIEETEEKNGFILRYYKVYRLENTKGIKEIKKRANEKNSKTREEIYFKNKPIEELDKIINDYLVRENIKLNVVEQDRAYYRPSNDSITMPELRQFHDSREFYQTLFHELGHSTGIYKRLNRDMTGNFGSKKYAKEELVAEICSCYSMSEMNYWGENTSDNNIAYLQSWVGTISSELEKKKWLLYQASKNAEQAFKYIFNIHEEKETMAKA